jgi:hypothetical protein
MFGKAQCTHARLHCAKSARASAPARRLGERAIVKDQANKQGSTDNADVEREIRDGRKFSPAEALSRLAGPGAMKGASPVSRVQQAHLEIDSWLAANLTDEGGSLRIVLQRHLKDSDLLLSNLETPLLALSRHCQHLLASDYLLNELVREADVEWGSRMDERPYFQIAGSMPHPADPYTCDSVRTILASLLPRLAESTRSRAP